ncbi:MAG: nucleotidyltransferase family protein [Pirellulales bacterium]|nr:nucleotidyltransferase family protein [Pirellulales bacterium]
MTHHGLDIPTDQIAEFCRRNRIARLALFGSVLREDFDAASDVDVLVEFLPGTNVGLRFFSLERELSEIIGRRVDLNTPGFLDRYYREEVLREAEVIHDDA